MKKILVFSMAILSFFNLFGEIADKHYTTDDYFNEMRRDKAVLTTKDVVRLVTYDKDHVGNFYDYILQGLFVEIVQTNKKYRSYMQTSQFQLIKKLFDSEVSRQEFGETLKGIQNLLKEENPQYSPCVIAFGMIWEILPNRKKLTEDDVKFFADFYSKTDSKLLQQAIYTVVFNGKNAVKYRNTILKYGNYNDICYLINTMVIVTEGKERQKWIKKLQEHKEICPELNDLIDSFLNTYKRSYPSEMPEL